MCRFLSIIFNAVIGKICRKDVHESLCGQVLKFRHPHIFLYMKSTVFSIKRERCFCDAAIKKRLTKSKAQMASQRGVEPPAYCLGGSRSIQLSYWDNIYIIPYSEVHCKFSDKFYSYNKILQFFADCAIIKRYFSKGVLS